MKGKYYWLIFLIMLSSCAASRQSKMADTKSDDLFAVDKVLQDQAAAWNRGDLEGYMQGYWQSDDLTFTGKSGVTYGWQKTLDNYRKGYATPEDMGKLTFNLEKAEHLCPGVIQVIGKWQLVRTKGDIGGYFTLIFRKIENHWVIVSDHTS